jgi:diacylglycerol O-acyltransferase
MKIHHDLEEIEMSSHIPISAMDRFFLRQDSAETPMHTASLNVYRLPAGAPRDYLRQLFAHLQQYPATVPPFNYVVAGSPRFRPAWRIADRVDLEYHLRHSALPLPGGERELGMLISRLHSHRLDFSRPLWEFHLIEGLEDNRFATYLKMHHALADGITVVSMITAAMSENPDARGLAPPWAIASTISAPHSLSRDEARQATVAQGDRDRASLLRAFARIVKAQWLQRDTGLVAPYVPRSVLNRPLTAARRYATQSYKITRLKAVGKAWGGTVNDVFLAICSGALRRYLIELNALPRKSLIATVPVALEREVGETLGTVVTLLTVSLATHLEDPRARFQAIVDSARQAKHHLLRMPRWKTEIYRALLLLPLARLSMRAKAKGLLSHLPVSNVPGPGKKLYFEGAEVEALYPCSVVLRNFGLNVTARSYNDTINLGFLGCRDFLPHFQHLAVYAGEALSELEALTCVQPAQDPLPPSSYRKALRVAV